MRRSPTVTSPAKGYSPPNAKSFITRVTSPFSSKQQSQVRQEIRLDEPFRQYFSGDYVKGAVHLKTAKPLRITHIVIRLHGFVKVVNTPRQPGEDIPYDENLLTSMRSRRGIEYFGNGFARLFEDECILCGDGRLSGEYEFRFELKLPSKNVPSSIDVRFKRYQRRFGADFADIFFLVRAWYSPLPLVLYSDTADGDSAHYTHTLQAQCYGDA